MSLHSMEEFGSSTVEIFPGKTFNINKNLEILQQEKLIKTLQQHSSAYAWEYTNMKELVLRLVYITSILRKIVNLLDNLK